MAQITAGDGTIDPTVVDGTDLAARLERLYAADQSQNSGPARPATLAAGGLWVKTGAADSPELYMYDGATDILIMNKNGMSSTLDDVLKNGNTSTLAATLGGLTVNGDGHFGNNIVKCFRVARAGLTGIHFGADSLRPFDDALGTTPDAKFDFGGSSVRWKDGHFSNQVFAGGTALTSDRRLKSNVADEPVDLDALAALKPKRYTMGGVEQVGLIAQELEAVAPHCVITTPLTPLWDAAGSYTEGDTVAHSKKIYEALSDVQTGIQPDDVWTPAVDAIDAVFDDDGKEVTPAKDAIPAKGGWKPVGDAPLAADGSVMTEQKAISVGPLQAMMMGAVSELVAENKALKAQISAIEARLTALEAK